MGTFIVCWVLMHQPVVMYESCTPEMSLERAQLVMKYVAEAGDYLNLSIKPSPVIVGGPAQFPTKAN